MKQGRDYMPTFIVEKLSDISPDELVKQGVKGILIDMDNTLAYDNSYKLIPGVQSWTEAVKKSGLKICIISNGFAVRVYPVARGLDIPFICHSYKPKVSSYEKAAAKIGLGVKDCVMVGDQLLTDICGANWCGMTSYYVLPFSFETNPFYRNMFKKRRWDELEIINKYNKTHGTSFDLPPQIKSVMAESK